MEFLDLVAQADLVRSGEVSPLELVDAAISRAEECNPALGAIVLPFYEQARAQARAELPDGPLRGVPILLKDLGAQLAGMPSTSGMRVLKEAGWHDPVDSHFAARLRQAGVCFLGRTNSPELGLYPATEPEAWGPTHNPWKRGYSPGGSSGGSASAVAAGIVAAAHASDGGGSIRIPASHCGLVGLKPTRARSSFGPGAGERWGGFSCEGFVTRTVRDTAALLDVVSGAMPGDPNTAPLPPRSFSESLAPGPRLRVGVMTNAPRDTPVDPAVIPAAEVCARALEGLGHTVEAAYPPALDDPTGIGAYVTIVAAGIGRALDVWGEKLGRALTEDDVEPLTWALAESARKRTATDYLAALDQMNRFVRAVAVWWDEGFDLLVTPCCAAPPPPHGNFQATREEPFAGFASAAPFGVYTMSFNLTGQPGISVPLHWTDAGLPIGSHIVGPFGREDILLSVAAELEQVLPWADKRPPRW
jgi:amidase